MGETYSIIPAEEGGFRVVDDSDDARVLCFSAEKEDAERIANALNFLDDFGGITDE